MKKLMAILLSLTLACAAVLPALAEGKKDETVYVLANPDGSARRVIVSDYLKRSKTSRAMKPLRMAFGRPRAMKSTIRATAVKRCLLS